jgi:hypothetical protein
MKTTEIHKFLMSLGVRFTAEGLEHYMRILQLIAYKMLNPEIPESNFVTLVAQENWSKAQVVADTRNKEAFGVDLFQKFVAYVKTTPQYISKKREEKLNLIIK